MAGRSVSVDRKLRTVSVGSEVAFKQERFELSGTFADSFSGLSLKKQSDNR